MSQKLGGILEGKKRSCRRVYIYLYPALQNAYFLGGLYGAHIKTIELTDGDRVYRLFFYLNNRQMSKYFPPPIKRKEVDPFKIELERNIKLYKAELSEYDKLLEFIGLRPKISKLTLSQFAKFVLTERMKNVSNSTIKRN